MFKRRTGAVLAMASAVACVLSTSAMPAQAAPAQAAPAQAAPAQAAPAKAAPKDGVSDVANYLRQTLDQLQFQQVLDTAPPGSAASRALRSQDKNVLTPRQVAKMTARTAGSAPPQPIVQQPQIDATVLELDGAGRIVDSGTSLMSPDYPHGVTVPVDGDFHTDAVRWRQWDDSGWYTNKGKGTIDIVPGREKAPLDFMAPYPASVLKLMVGFGVLRLVDSGVVKLDDTYNYVPDPKLNPALCHGNTTNTIRTYLDHSLTYSSNEASCALIKLLWDHNAIDGLNQTFQNLGLETLQLIGTHPGNGGGWTNSVTMTSLDTAKLLALVNGGPGTLWTAPNGTPVTRDALSESSRDFFKGELGQYAFNDNLSTANFCGASYPAPGIPQVVPQRWINPDGTVTAADDDLPGGDKFGHDVRPCNAAAEVSFAHKTGYVNNSAADAGIVRNLPGKDGRHYVIVVFSNLGNQYVDANATPPPAGFYGTTQTEKFAKLGLAMDQYETQGFTQIQNKSGRSR